jgi:hypothetical protein
MPHARFSFALFAVVSALFAGAASARAQGGYYSYYVLSYPKVFPTCQEAADAVAGRLHEQTGVAITSASCSHETKTEYSLKIVYQADAELSRVTTDRTESVSGFAGSYGSLKDCAASLQTEIDLFTKNTGLDWVVAYCYNAPFYGSTQSYAVRIDGFGQPKKWPQWFEKSIARPEYTEDSLAAAIEERLEERGVDVARSFIRHDSTMFTRLNVRYYAAHATLGLNDSYGFDTLARCQATRDQVSSLYKSGGADVIIPFCSNSSPSALYVVIFDIPMHLDVVADARPFETYEQCEGAKLDALATYQAKGIKVYGGFCEGYKKGEVRLQILMED